MENKLKKFTNKTLKGKFTFHKNEIYTIIMKLIKLGYKIKPENVEDVVKKIERIRILNTSDIYDTRLPEMEEIEEGVKELVIPREDVITFEWKIYNYCDITNIMDSVIKGKKSSDRLHTFIRKLIERGCEVNLNNLRYNIRVYEETKAEMQGVKPRQNKKRNS